jgi:4-diphosphocytidyl-2C-methyl-D-erythritol kinase
MQAISLCDDVSVRVSGAFAEGDYGSSSAGSGGAAAAFGSGFEVFVETVYASDARSVRRRALPCNADNIAYKAALAAADLCFGGGFGGPAAGGAPHEPHSSCSVRISIEKRIPLAAGLAGGSADAAAVLIALTRIFSPNTPLAEVLKAASRVGADVPFCAAAIAWNEPSLGYSKDVIASSSALCSGIGDVLSPVRGARGFVVLIKPDIEVPTPEIYAAFDAARVLEREVLPDGGHSGHTFLQDAETEREGFHAGNDLESAAISRYPLIGELMGEVRAVSGAERVFMTGSGPTIVACYNVGKSAGEGFAALRAKYENRADIDAVILSELL